jgi:hypothetical protein
MPAATTAPASPAINPGKITLMIGGWGGERFDNVLTGTGGNNNFFRLMYAFPIAASPKGEPIPGLATDWTSTSGRGPSSTMGRP